MSWPDPSGSFEGLDMITGQQREELQERVPSPRASLARSRSDRETPAESNPGPVRMPFLLSVLVFVFVFVFVTSQNASSASEVLLFVTHHNFSICTNKQVLFVELGICGTGVRIKSWNSV